MEALTLECHIVGSLDITVRKLQFDIVKCTVDRINY